MLLPSWLEWQPHCADHQTEQTRFSLSSGSLLPLALCLREAILSGELSGETETYEEFKCFLAKFRNAIRWLDL